MDYVRAVNALGSMREPAFLILAVLAQEDLHGYGIVKKVESLSDGEVHLALGTLYGALDRLGDKGLVEVAGEERQGKRLRRYYRLTDSGATALRQEIEGSCGWPAWRGPAWTRGDRRVTRCWRR